ncbi:hypothetical protein, partial [Pectobacterium brasiliense]|uniref:hypothetical protein n=1 Tax=Pectobacterium brasiliense TaxID=180957 RepID=UPI001CF24369
QRGALNRIGHVASMGFCHKAERLRYFQAIVLFASQFLAILSARLYPSYFKLHVRWLRSVTRITYLSKLIGTPFLAALRCSLMSIALKG